MHRLMKLGVCIGELLIKCQTPNYSRRVEVEISFKSVLPGLEYYVSSYIESYAMLSLGLAVGCTYLVWTVASSRAKDKAFELPAAERAFW